MRIANPIYDVVFKYLMEDNEIAKDILSTVLDKTIISLEFRPQEIAVKSENGVQVMRLDFKAEIKTETGELKTILIELQKERDENDEDLTRFRRYLGENYMAQVLIKNADGARQYGKNLPIVAIYFLGFRLKGINLPILKVERRYFNGITGRKWKKKMTSPFIEQLSHDLYAIQIPRLKMNVTTEKEQLLEVFNQNKYKTDDKHFLEYTGDMSNPKVGRIVKRLHEATIDFDVMRQIWAQEEMEIKAERKQRALEAVEAQLEKAEEAEAQARLALVEARREKREMLKANKLARKANEVVRKEIEVAVKAKEEARKAEEEARKEKVAAEAHAQNLEKQLAELTAKMNALNLDK